MTNTKGEWTTTLEEIPIFIAFVHHVYGVSYVQADEKPGVLQSGYGGTFEQATKAFAETFRCCLLVALEPKA
jgi:hypothetical protein